jgi:hypothetical protein
MMFALAATMLMTPLAVALIGLIGFTGIAALPMWRRRELARKEASIAAYLARWKTARDQPDPAPADQAAPPPTSEQHHNAVVLHNGTRWR